MITNETKQLGLTLDMKTILYAVSVILVFAWSLGFFVYSLNTSAHLLLMLAIIIGVVGIFKKS